jgi:hypothetical protein
LDQRFCAAAQFGGMLGLFKTTTDEVFGYRSTLHTTPLHNNHSQYNQGPDQKRKRRGFGNTLAKDWLVRLPMGSPRLTVCTSNKPPSGNHS